jgi:hypothetical protein
MVRGFALIAIFCVFGGAGKSAFAAVVCPSTYVDDGASKCIPSLSVVGLFPKTEFTTNADGNAICGAGRVALSSDGNYTWSQFSSSGRPRYNGGGYSWTSSDGHVQNYDYVSSTSPNEPLYGYGPASRCYCLGKGMATSLTEAAPQYPSNLTFSQTITTPAGVPRQYPVTYDIINAQDYTANQIYGPVPISKNPANDGRAWADIVAGSTCGCPNVNEDVVTNGTDPAPVGVHCFPMLNAVQPTGGGIPGTARVLTPFVDPVAQGGQVMSGAWEQTDLGGAIATQIQLPSSGNQQDQLTAYARKIWTCAAPFEVNTATKTCVFNPLHHRCDDGTGGGPVSPVGDAVSPTGPANYATQFNNTINRKLACCMNSFHTDSVDAYEKFDCIDNSANALYTSFDDLWSKGDSATDGDQTNAIVLSDSTKISGAVRTPRIISGFYSLSGQHCDQFSEFAYAAGSTIKHYRVDPLIKSGQQTTVGAAPVYYAPDIPVGSGAGYTAVNANVTGALGKTVPTTAQDMLSCPILVRAAIITTCPNKTAVPNVLATVDRSATGAARCAAAAGIQIHVRIEQIFDITGTPMIKPVDSFSELNQTTSIDVTKMILDKTGDLCPPYSQKRGEHCVY